MTDMKRYMHILLALMAVAAPMALTGCEDDDNNKDVNDPWVLVWADEFNDPTPDNRPDPAKWTYEIGASGYGNQEKQNYTDRVENACYAVEDNEGCLKITALADNYQGVQYSSARLKTEGRFATTYGRFEARMKLPYGPGMWPAFWLLGANYPTATWPLCGEIDIMENKGYQPNIVSSAVHCPGHSGGNPFTSTFGYQEQRFDTGFHIFAVEWDETKIEFSVDGYPYHTVLASQMLRDEWVFNHPFFIILNLAVGGVFGGDPTDATVFPQSLYVDYVRVYQRKSQITSDNINMGGSVSDWNTGGDTDADIE